MRWPWGYRMTDPNAELLFRILRVSLLERALATTSLHNRLVSLAFAWQLHLPGEETQAAAGETRRRRIGLFAIEEGRRAAQRDFHRHQQAERLWDLLQARGQLLLPQLRMRVEQV